MQKEICMEGIAEMNGKISAFTVIRILQILAGILLFGIIMLAFTKPLYAEEETFSAEGTCEAFEPYITCTEYIRSDGSVYVRVRRETLVASKNGHLERNKQDYPSDTAEVLFISGEDNVEVSDRYYIGDKIYVYNAAGRKVQEYQVRQECAIDLPEVQQEYDGGEICGWVSEWDDIRQVYEIRPLYKQKTIVDEEKSAGNTDAFLEMNGIHVKEQKPVCVLHWIIFGLDALLGVFFFARLMASLSVKE